MVEAGRDATVIEDLLLARGHLVDVIGFGHEASVHGGGDTRAGVRQDRSPRCRFAVGCGHESVGRRRRQARPGRLTPIEYDTNLTTQAVHAA